MMRRMMMSTWFASGCAACSSLAVRRSSGFIAVPRAGQKSHPISPIPRHRLATADSSSCWHSGLTVGRRNSPGQPVTECAQATEIGQHCSAARSHLLKASIHFGANFATCGNFFDLGQTFVECRAHASPRAMRLSWIASAMRLRPGTYSCRGRVIPARLSASTCRMASATLIPGFASCSSFVNLRPSAAVTSCSPVR
jgi:hypothetical protein